MRWQAAPQRSGQGQWQCCCSAGASSGALRAPGHSVLTEGGLFQGTEPELPVLPWGCWTGCARLPFPSTPSPSFRRRLRTWGWGCVFLACDRFARCHKLAVLGCFPSIKRKVLQNCLEYKWIPAPYVAIYIYIHLGHAADLVMEQVLVVSSSSSAHKHLSANNWIWPRLHLNCSL